MDVPCCHPAPAPQLIPKDPDDWPCLEEPADYTSAQARMEKEIRFDPHLVDFFMEFQV